ncbi:hypothetical protein CR164_09625 [Prosthecochloris marina]|uniref:Uncharacterized protein n=1 Tax=Prosthecochloris marina TaxID=2017681 RepID=A0A317T8B2_9CHLB|nr:hypothetical protein CR164_09625 [Prosthecochloris marina]
MELRLVKKRDSVCFKTVFPEMYLLNNLTGIYSCRKPKKTLYKKKQCAGKSIVVFVESFLRSWRWKRFQ